VEEKGVENQKRSYSIARKMYRGAGHQLQKKRGKKGRKRNLGIQELERFDEGHLSSKETELKKVNSLPTGDAGEKVISC